MRSLEQSMRKLAANLTGADISKVPPGELERVIDFLAENVAVGSGEAGPAGASVTAINLAVDAEGKVTGGTATLSDGSTVNITVTTE